MKQFDVRTLRGAALGLILATIGALTACGSDSNNDKDSDTEMASFEISVTNLSANQPLSPLAALLHDANYQAWSLGGAASLGLELLAEGGDNSDFIGADSAMLMASASGSAPVGPGGSDTITVSAHVAAVMQITLASMLVNSNDGFTGTSGLDVSALAVGDSMQHYLPIYDAGTEANDEMAGTIPGPADGGEGFNALRDDVDYVARHPGVVTQGDGYTSSVLVESHRFDAPIAKLVVKRLK